MSQCPICDIYVAHLEEHHIIPREYGGENLDTINICSTCHHGLHHQADALWTANKQTNLKGKRVTPRYYFTADIYQNALPYIQAIINARYDWESVGSPAVRKRQLIISVPNSLLQRLHKLKKYKGYRSLDRFIVDQLTNLVEKNL